MSEKRERQRSKELEDARETLESNSNSFSLSNILI